MKIALSILALVLFGLGEYTLVEFYPLQPEQRLNKARQLPLVASFVRAADMRLVRDAIEESENGYLILNTGTKHGQWSTPEALFADIDAGSFEARQMLYVVRHRDEIAANLDRTRSLAEAGEPSAMVQLYLMGKTLTGPVDMNRGIELLENDGSATASWYLEVMVRKSLDMSSAEGLLLTAQMMREDRCSSLLPEKECVRVSAENRVQLRKLYEAAAAGDEDAQWVVERLSEDQAEVRINS